MPYLLAIFQDHGEEAQDAAHAAGEFAGGPMEFHWLPALTSVVVFIAAFLILWRTVWPRITKALDERDQKILDEIKSAEEARKQANAALAGYERELAQARDEASRMIQQARADAKATADDLRARNEEDLSELRERARRDIQSAKETAISEIHAEAATLATAIASKILQREISVEDQQRLVNESLSQLSAVDN